MKERIQQLRFLANPLEATLGQRELWTRQVTDHAQRFVESLGSRPVFRFTQGEGKEILGEPLAEAPVPIESLLKVLVEQVEEPGVKLGAPGFMGFIPISSLYPAALGDYLAAVINPFAGNFFASPGAVRLEYSLTRWMADLVGYPKTAAGDLSSGGSLSNLTAVVSAREACQLRARDYEKAVVYLTSQTHHSVSKALRIAGLGDCIQRVVILDRRYRMNAAALDEAVVRDRQAGLRPWLVVASAGSTDTGAVDPLPAIAQVAQEQRLWLHVDGAYGAMFALCAEGRQLLAGLERSDSLTLDPHKGLFMPCGSGAVLVRDGQALLRAYQYHAAYMQDRPMLGSLDEISPSELSPELTRPFRGLRLWLSLKLLGLRAFRAALEEKLLLARYFHQRIGQIQGFEVGPPPDLSIVIFRFVPPAGDANDFNLRLLLAVERDGRIFLTSTRLEGKVWLRLAVLCSGTHLEQIDLALELLRELANAI